MKRYLFLLLFLTACFSRSTAMTRESYDAVGIGSTMADLQEHIGKPNLIRKKANNVEEYEYIERLSVNNDYSIENIYYIEVLNGVVVGKHMKTKRSPAYDFIYDTEPNFSPNYSQYNP